MTLQSDAAATFLALVADADSGARRLYADCLTPRHWSVLLADSGPEALAMAISHHPDVIVSETSLPGFDGFALCELLHIDAGTSGIPLMFITADATPGNLARAQRSGADAVLTKPCRPAKLLDAVEVLAPGGQILDRSQVLTRKASDQVAASQALLDGAATQRMTLKKAHHRGDTTTPPSAPPELRCELCDGNLDYVRSHIGGVSIKNPEQWDYYVCPASCGHFEYRVRTRKLRKAP